MTMVIILNKLINILVNCSMENEFKKRVDKFSKFIDNNTFQKEQPTNTYSNLI